MVGSVAAATRSEVDLAGATLDANDIAELEATLVAEAQRLRSVIQSSLLEESEIRHDIAGHDEMDDILTNVEAQRTAYDAQEAQTRLVLVEAARRRMVAGNYGTCGECGAAIARDRLIALPTAERCINCQQVRRRTRR